LTHFFLITILTKFEGLYDLTWWWMDRCGENW